MIDEAMLKQLAFGSKQHVSIQHAKHNVPKRVAARLEHLRILSHCRLGIFRCSHGRQDHQAAAGSGDSIRAGGEVSAQRLGRAAGVATLRVPALARNFNPCDFAFAFVSTLQCFTFHYIAYIAVRCVALRVCCLALGYIA